MLGDNFPTFNSDENLAKEAIKSNAYNHLKCAVKQYGLEGTEDKIKEIYKYNPKTVKYLLKILKAIWKGV